jgi:hypothetical protein
LQNQLPGQKIWRTHHSTNSIEPKITHCTLIYTLQ